jgi:hypothetical protein
MPFITDPTQVKDVDKLDPEVTTAMLWVTIPIGMPRLTESNAEEFYRRVRAYELLAGNFMRDADGGVYPVTPEIVRRYIGLETNASPLTAVQFKTQLARWATDYANEDWVKAEPATFYAYRRLDNGDVFVTFWAQRAAVREPATFKLLVETTDWAEALAAVERGRTPEEESHDQSS